MRFVNPKRLEPVDLLVLVEVQASSVPFLRPDEGPGEEDEAHDGEVDDRGDDDRQVEVA